MDFKDFTAGKNDSDRRLDKVIRIFISDISLSEVYKYIRKGLIKINGKKTKAEYKVQENDVISVASFILKSESQEKTTEKHLKMPSVIFENEHLLIIDKPFDTLVHGSEDSLDKVVEQYYKSEEHSDSLSFTPGPLHRIDKKTTGLLCFSKSLKGAQWFSENLKAHNIQKKYFGIIQGTLKNKEIWQDFIKKEETSGNNFHTVEAETEKNDENKDAYTEVSPLSYGKYKNIDFTVVEFYIKTGRTHQIRAQSALHKHPLLGDTAYGGNKITAGRQDFYLQSKELIFPQNELGIPEVVKLDKSKNMIDFLNYCEKQKSEL